MFIEVNDRRGSGKKVAINISHIASFEEDGTGSIIYLNNNREILCVNESYAELLRKIRGIA